MFWIFMLIMDLVVPFSMIGFGLLFMKKSPKEINDVFGYRTAMSMKNRDIWAFAHNYCGRLWFMFGLVLLPIAVVSLTLVTGQSDSIVGTVGGLVCAAEIIPMICSFTITENALKRNFDKDGNRRSQL